LGKVVCLVYADDTFLYAENLEEINVAIKAIEDAGMHLEVEDNVAGFLGVLIGHKGYGTLQMTEALFLIRSYRHSTSEIFGSNKLQQSSDA
jgi:hypothetical protein